MYEAGYSEKTIIADNVDTLVAQAIEHIRSDGTRIYSRAGDALQAFSVNYVLSNSRARIHCLRVPESLRYFCRELTAYFKGSSNVHDGLSQASIFWEKVANDRGEINSNYGTYIFHQRINGLTQYEWVITALKRNYHSRRALCNINQVVHKDLENKDFPCAVGVQFLIRNDRLCCEVSSRSEDVIIGLPYDIGFFSFLTELVYRDLKESTYSGLSLGYTSLRCSFTQIYDRTAHIAERIIVRSRSGPSSRVGMPSIESAKGTLEDIYNGTQETRVMQWICENAL
jgi:thymidylate synthase